MVAVLCLGILVPRGMLQFIVNFPVYIGHYQHHNQEHGNMSWMEFFNAHIAEDHHHENEHAGHDKLPFNHQHSDDCCKSQNFIPYNIKSSVHFHMPVLAEIKVAVNYFFSSSDYTKNIWQPPKSC